MSTVVALALITAAPSAFASGQGSVEPACLSQRLAGFGPSITSRLILRGKVSCNKARRTLRAYERAILDGRCPTEICTQVVFAGGWRCSSPIPAISREHPRLEAGCERRGASFKVYKARVPSNAAEFRVRLTDGIVGCGLASEEQMVCQGIPPTIPGSEQLVQVATLKSDGQVTACTEYGLADGHCFQGNLGDPIPELSPGNLVMSGPFACKVLETGVECAVVVTGKGFFITPNEITLVGR